MDGVRAAQVALTLGALLGQDVTTERVVALEAARGSLLETFRRAPVGFQLWHRALRFTFN
jgi:hypothetical protein